MTFVAGSPAAATRCTASTSPTGSDRQLDLPGEQAEEGRARLARTKEHVTAGQLLLPGIGGDGLQERLG
jgi:hypothetical protein